MSATRPEANTEYSRAPHRSGALSVVLVGGLLGALLLVVSQFTTLYQVHVATSAVAIKSQGTGSNHLYALIPVAVLAAVLTIAAFRLDSRPAMLAIGALGVLALLIALIGDLPDSHATGIVGSSVTHYVDASSTPSAGLYMETLGAVVLIVTCGFGLMLRGTSSAGATGLNRPSRPRSAS